MEPLLKWGIDVIKIVQSVQNPVLTTVISVVTLFGDIWFYLPALLILFWCVNGKTGFKLTALVLFSVAINTIIKMKLCVPRPFLIDPSVKIGFEATWSTPSGHAQQAAVFWGMAAFLNRHTPHRRAFFAAAVIVPLVIGFTRVYLGVHYPSDVVIGWALGALITAACVYAVRCIGRFPAALACKPRLILAAAISFVLVACCPAEPAMAAAFFGFAAGYILLDDRGGFDAGSGSVVQKILRFFCGVLLTAGVFAVCRMIPAAIAEKQAPLISFITYAATSFTITYAAPRTFIRLKLARAAKDGNANSGSADKDGDAGHEQ